MGVGSVVDGPLISRLLPVALKERIAAGIQFLSQPSYPLIEGHAAVHALLTLESLYSCSIRLRLGWRLSVCMLISILVFLVILEAFFAQEALFVRSCVDVGHL